MEKEQSKTKIHRRNSLSDSGSKISKETWNDSCEAVRNSDEKKIFKILKKHPKIVYNTDISNGKSLLHIAVSSGNELAHVLIEKGNDVNIPDHNGDTPIFDAVLAEQLNMVRLLLAFGGSVRVKNNQQMTPLFVASYWGNLEIVKLLVENGSEVNAQDSFGRTPLWISALKGHLEIVKYLREQGGNISIAGTHKDGVSYTAAEIAQHKGHFNIMAYITKQEKKKKKRMTPLEIEPETGGNKDYAPIPPFNPNNSINNNNNGGAHHSRPASLSTLYSSVLSLNSTPNTNYITPPNSSSGVIPPFDPSQSLKNSLTTPPSSQGQIPAYDPALSSMSEQQVSMIALQQSNEKLKKENEDLKKKIETVKKELTDWQHRTHALHDRLVRLMGDNSETLSLDQLQYVLTEQQAAMGKVQKTITGKMKQMKEDRLCMICMEKTKDTVFIPCYHVAVCEGCSTKDIKKCPVCDVQVVLHHKIFI